MSVYALNVPIKVLIPYDTSSTLTLGLASNYALSVGFSREVCVAWFMATMCIFPFALVKSIPADSVILYTPG